LSDILESLNRHDVTPELVEEVLEGLMVSEFALDDYVDEKGESFSVKCVSDIL